jgi:hypothetical protein
MKCQHDGCENDGEECYLSCVDRDTEQDVPDGYYCGDHAADHGFCPCCGEFWGGIGTFEMRGICDHCHDELEDEIDEHLEYIDWED